MANDFQRMVSEVYLAEYKAARDEYVMILKQREEILFLSLVITGALFSFYFTGSTQISTSRDYRILSLYLVVPLAMLTGARWIEQGWRARCIDAYIGEVLSVRLNAVLASGRAVQPDFPVAAFSGTQEAHRAFEKTGAIHGLPAAIHRFVYYGCFVAPGVLSQWLIFDRSTGSLSARLTSLSLPIFYFGNCVMLAACVSLPILRALGVRILKPKWSAVRSA